jgi:hypothetical protein
MRTALLFLFLMVFSSIYCQTSFKNEHSWMDCGLGASRFGKREISNNGFSFYFSEVWSIDKFTESTNGLGQKNNTWKIRFILHYENGNENDAKWRQDLGFLYGKTFGNAFQVNISGGIGLFKGKKTVINYPNPNTHGVPTYSHENYLIPTLPLELGVSLIPFKFFGVGVAGFVNINSLEPIIGFIVKLEMGERR